MADFTRGLAQCGARVIGLGEHSVGSLPSVVKQSLSDYLRVQSLVDTDAVLATVRASAAHTPIDRVECLWEPFMTLAAQLREMLDIGGMHTAQTELFRDKKKMKDALDAAGLRTPRNISRDRLGRDSRSGRNHRSAAGDQAHRRRRLGAYA